MDFSTPVHIVPRAKQNSQGAVLNRAKQVKSASFSSRIIEPKIVGFYENFGIKSAQSSILYPRC